MTGNLALLAQDMTGVEYKAAGPKNGGEYAGPCPACGGTDRFRVWPRQKQGHGFPGGYWCRQCGAAGDVFQFLMDFKGMTFPEACAALGRDIPFDRGRAAAPPVAPRAERWSPAEVAPPPEAWRAKAGVFVSWAHEQLLASPLQLAYLRGRGIGEDAVRRWRLGFNPQDAWRDRAAWGLPPGKGSTLWLPGGIVIPYVRDGVLLRVRIRRHAIEPGDGYGKYIAISGSRAAATWISRLDAQVYQIIEAELDCMVVELAAGDLIGVAGLGSLSMKPDRYAHAALARSKLILDSLDYEPEADARDKAQGPRSRAWWKRTYPDQYERCPAPQGKDPGEAFERGVPVRAWIVGYLPPAMQRAAAGSAGGSGLGGSHVGGEGKPCALREEAPEPAEKVTAPEPEPPRRWGTNGAFFAGWDRLPRACADLGIGVLLERRCKRGELCAGRLYWEGKTWDGKHRPVPLNGVPQCPWHKKVVKFLRSQCGG